MSDLILAGGTVLTKSGTEAVDVRIRDGVIVEMGAGLEGGETIDCKGAWVGPGLVDLHAHFREPGQEWKEDIESGSRAAAAGGYTAVFAMPNTDPATDSGHLARFVSTRGAEVGLAEVLPVGAITKGRAGKELAHLDELWAAGVRVFSDDGDVVADAGLLRQAMDYLAARGGVISQHAVDVGLSSGGYMHEGSVSSLLGMYGIPSAADDVILARDIRLVEMTGARYHVQHLSTATGVELVAAAKAKGLPVTAEVTPHHLAFDHTAAQTTDPVYKMMPPLRSDEDRAALRRGLEDGTIDIVGTDHAPHAAHEKEVPWEHAPNGVLGLEWAAAVANTFTDLDQGAFFDRLSLAPARIGQVGGQGLLPAEGGPANLMVFDPKAEWTPATTVSKSENSPYFGLSLHGKVIATIYRGEVTARDGIPAR
ncbi:MAG: dihydroorotase [Actinomycetota bacterium]|nr:dihydroorotase [Actinomycetota bacterium]